jgi:xanthine dehydrogenase accessory factor
MAGDGLGVVRVLDRHGFGTVESGQLLAGTASGELAGVLYRGALDDAAVPLAAASAGAPQTRDAHVAEHAALAAGLACSGGATLLGHPLPAALAAALGAALESGVPVALVSTADGTAALVLTGSELAGIVGTLGSVALDDTATAAARALLRRGATVTERVPAGDRPELLLDLWVPVPSVLIVGSGAIGTALEAQATLLGWSARCASELDATVAAVAAFCDADVLVLLDHDPAFDAALAEGLRGRGFIGALGSRHTQAARRERLRAAGLTDDELARLHGPVGLDLGARTPAETAVSIVAQVIAARAGRAGTALTAADGRIGG